MPRTRTNIFQNVDWLLISLYFLLVFLGWLSIYSVTFDKNIDSIIDLSTRYGKQLMWIGTSVLIIFIILIIEGDIFAKISYPIYGVIIILLILVLFVARDIKGAKSWIELGGFRLQPSEFAKFATCLALSKYVSNIEDKLYEVKHILISFMIIVAPAILIIIQGDAGSALVYSSLAFVMYRSGLSGHFLVLGFIMTVLFILALVLEPLNVIGIVSGMIFLIYLILNKDIKEFFIYLGLLILITFAVKLLLQYSFNFSTFIPYKSLISFFSVLIFVSFLMFLYNYMVTKRIKPSWYFYLIPLCLSILFVFSVDYVFENILEEHQRTRINILLGLDSDPLGAGYNVNQSKIAIGSGGFFGKGFLNGALTRYNFVPEQSTDFIFCTIGEEWGFVGAGFVISLFTALLIRIIWVAERQRSSFSRIYGYGLASILFFHLAINIGMTVGLAPVIGIPLPFFSYGGSSLWGFTILLFIFVRLDANRLQVFR